jgi:hypothetical protein
MVFIFLLLLAIRLPIIIAEGTITHADLHFMVIGEKMNDGAQLYVQVWDNIAPFAAFVYWIIDILFGRSHLAYQLLAMLLVMIQAGLFNKILLDNKAINENSYIPALIYVLCMSLFFDFFTLTPMLMSITFLLLALNYLFQHIEIRAKRDEQILSIGLYIGIAALFYLPVILLAPATLLILVLFTGTVFRRYLLLSFGVILPLLLLIGYYLLINGVRDFYYNFFNPWMEIEGEALIKFSSLIWIIGIPAIYTIMGLVKISQGMRFTNYQIRLTQVMFIWFIFSIGLMFFGAEVTPAKFIILVPPAAFYISHYFITFRKGLKSEISFSIFFLSIVFVSLGTFFNFFFTTRFIAYEKLLVDKTPYDELVQGKNVVVLGDNIDVFKDAKLATPYLNWSLSKPLFENPEYYDNLVKIYTSFKEDPPQIIIDPEGKIEEVSTFIPWFLSQYEKRGDTIYLLSN